MCIFLYFGLLLRTYDSFLTLRGTSISCCPNPIACLILASGQHYFYLNHVLPLRPNKSKWVLGWWLRVVAPTPKILETAQSPKSELDSLGFGARTFDWDLDSGLSILIIMPSLTLPSTTHTRAILLDRDDEKMVFVQCVGHNYSCCLESLDFCTIMRRQTWAWRGEMYVQQRQSLGQFSRHMNTLRHYK